MTLQIDDTYMRTVLEVKYYNDKTLLIKAIKSFFEIKTKEETQEYKLLKAYDDGILSIGQISNILDTSKNETIELLSKYKIPYIKVDKEYLEEEFNAFS